jgi:hypothetical protein
MILMNAVVIHVTQMLFVPICQAHILVHAILGMLEMEPPVRKSADKEFEENGLV